MSQLPILPPTPYLLTQLQNLLSKTSLIPQNALSLQFQTSCPKITDLYSPIDPSEILLDLIEKTSTAQLRKNWKYDETSYLIFIIDRYCCASKVNPNDLEVHDWHQISQLMPGRSSDNCRFRYLSLAPSSITDTPWQSQQRQLLITIIHKQQNTSINWKVVSEKLYELNPMKIYRTGKQCREHYTCFLKPNLKKGPWTDVEDYQLICLFMNHGKKWSKMAKYIEGRNENSIKNRFFLMFQNKRQGKLTNSDLTKLVKRKKQKLQKKLAKTQQQETRGEVSVDRVEPSQPSEEIQEEQPISSQIHSQNLNPIFIHSEQQLSYNIKDWSSYDKKQSFLGTSSEQIEKYITF